MKASNVDILLDKLNAINQCTSKLNYKTSAFINQQIIAMKPILEEEKRRLANEPVTIDCPKLIVFSDKTLENSTDIVSYTNNKLSELVENGYKIIDYGILNGDGICTYIKYTN